MFNLSGRLAKPAARRLPVMEDSTAMLPRATNSVIGHVSAWIAAAMLIPPSLPAVSCGCDRAAPLRASPPIECCCQRPAHSCCSSPSPTTCCSQQPPASCRGETSHVSSVGGGTDCCGTACRCSSPSATDTPIAPGPQEDHRQELRETVTTSLPSTSVPMIGISHAAPVASCEHLGRASALDRCVELSRFTC